jgi:Ca-activated chloride channel family protein
MRAPTVLGLCFLAACSLAWLDPARDRIAEGNRLFDAGDYAGAVEKYGQSLIDDPDSPMLNFNMGTAHYKAGNYADAVASFGRVRTEGERNRAASTAYNLGNAHYRIGVAAEENDLQHSIQAYAAALVAYRRSIAEDPTDQDAKFNYEFVARKLEELQQKLQEQQEQQEQEEESPPQQEQEQEQQQQGEEEQPDEQQPQDSSAQEQGGEEPQADESETAAQEGEEQESEPEAGQEQAMTEGREMSPQEAAALLDTARDDELQPDEFARRVQGTAVGEPGRDW